MKKLEIGYVRRVMISYLKYILILTYNKFQKKLNKIKIIEKQKKSYIFLTENIKLNMKIHFKKNKIKLQNQLQNKIKIK